MQGYLSLDLDHSLSSDEIVIVGQRQKKKKKTGCQEQDDDANAPLLFYDDALLCIAYYYTHTLVGNSQGFFDRLAHALFWCLHAVLCLQKMGL